MYRLFRRMYDSLVNFLKENGFMDMSEDEIIERIPKDSLRGKELMSEICKMKVGESKTFNFEPRDPFFAHGVEPIVTAFVMSYGVSVSASWDVQPRIGRYLMHVYIMES